jgi:hypothetical protein
MYEYSVDSAAWEINIRGVKDASRRPMFLQQLHAKAFM